MSSGEIPCSQKRHKARAQSEVLLPRPYFLVSLANDSQFKGLYMPFLLTFSNKCLVFFQGQIFLFVCVCMCA